MTAPLLDERTDARTEPTTGSGQYAHIVNNAKGEVVGAYIEGTVLEALCGHRWVPSRSPQGRPVCPQCKAVYDDDEAIMLANPRPTGEVRPRPDEI